MNDEPITIYYVLTDLGFSDADAHTLLSRGAENTKVQSLLSGLLISYTLGVNEMSRGFVNDLLAQIQEEK